MIYFACGVAVGGSMLRCGGEAPGCFAAGVKHGGASLWE